MQRGAGRILASDAGFDPARSKQADRRTNPEPVPGRDAPAEAPEHLVYSKVGERSLPGGYSPVEFTYGLGVTLAA